MTKTANKYELRMAAAEIICRHGDNYPEDGPVELPDNVVEDIATDLMWAGIPMEVVQELDEKPYEFLPHSLASHIHWISRRFRNSGGWMRLKQDNN